MYLIFIHKEDYPNGGAGDFQGTLETIDIGPLAEMMRKWMWVPSAINPERNYFVTVIGVSILQAEAPHARYGFILQITRTASNGYLFEYGGVFSTSNQSGQEHFDSELPLPPVEWPDWEKVLDLPPRRGD